MPLICHWVSVRLFNFISASRSDNWYNDLLFDEFEDLLPSEDVSGKHHLISYTLFLEVDNNGNGSPIEIAIDSDSSSDVVIVEELSQVSKTSRNDRVLRPRISGNTFHRYPSPPPPSSSKVSRNKRVGLFLCYESNLAFT